MEKAEIETVSQRSGFGVNSANPAFWTFLGTFDYLKKHNI